MNPGPTNWGRWGPDDELGAANFVTPAHVAAAAGLVRDGRVFSLGMTIRKDGVPASPVRAPAMHFMTLDGGDFAAGVRVGRGSYQAADDYLFMACAGTTHVDALSHFWYDGRLYNDHSPDRVRSYGAQRLGIQNLPGLVTRGVLLDIAGHHGVPRLAPAQVITDDDLAECAAAAGVTVGTGDCVLVRTGWLTAFAEDPAAYHESSPGIGLRAARWLADREVAAVGSDNVAIEVLLGPEEYEDGAPGPVAHRLLLRDCGTYLIELMDLEELAAAGATQFLFVLAPLKIHGGVNSPVNPIAIT